jgi:hypothetical protein
VLKRPILSKYSYNAIVTCYKFNLKSKKNLKILKKWVKKKSKKKEKKKKKMGGPWPIWGWSMGLGVVSKMGVGSATLDRSI